MPTPLHLVWIKRDARVHDHAALTAAVAAGGEVAAVYVFEPEVWCAPEHDGLHWHIVVDGLLELRERLDALGIPLWIRTGRLPEVFADLHAARPIASLFAHEETGNRVTYDRDLRVAAWARGAGARFVELPQNGVVRRLRSRDGWADAWKRRMRAPVLAPPEGARGAAGLPLGELPMPESFGLTATRRALAMRGGEARARRLLHSFLYERGVDYRSAMSSPLEGWDSCSRLSSAFAWGHLSVRTAWHATLARREDVNDAERCARAAPGGSDDLPPAERPDPRWAPSLRSFEKRLAWHCHFMQKLEDEPAIEFHNMNRAFDGLRDETMDADARARFEAWKAGQTGYPMVDACMRALHQAGWINFRMRAMLMSFAAYHLWLHWREPALWLAAQFQDFEPGIHFSQCQMQSGVTGINTIRIYSPAKQVLDQDPEGHFVRRFVPELQSVPQRYLAEPHTMPPLTQWEVGMRIGVDYPAPIVEHATAYREAKARVHAWKRMPDVRAEAADVYARHGSRRRPSERGGAAAKRAARKDAE